MKILQTITLKQALEWQDTDEKFSYVCDTFGCYADQEGRIAMIEAYLSHLLNFNQDDYLKHLS